MIEQINSVAFLAYPEMVGLLQSELKNRFGIENFPSKVYGDMLVYDLDALPKKDILPYFQPT